jgi:outer membrane protein assembly factor BamB
MAAVQREVRMPNRGLPAALLGAMLAITQFAQAEEANWPRFRGMNGTGHSQLVGLPTEWTSADYEWVRKLPGKGHSSPVIWGDKLFVTCGQDDGKRTLVCLNANTGDELWANTMTLGASHLHLKNSYASGSPAVDGEKIFAAFADDQHYVVKAFTFGGDQVWEKDLGSFTSQHGQGVSPMLVGDLLVVPNDQAGPSSIVALNKNTGETAWTTKDRPSEEVSYATPMLLAGPDGKDQLIVVSQATGISGLDPATGGVLWSTGPFPLRTCGSPVYDNGVIVATCGQGGNGKYLAAVEPAAAGQTPKTRYTKDRELPYVPTPIAFEGHLYLWLDGGVVSCLNMATGESVRTERVGGKFSGSPVLIDGKLYCISEAGEVVVVAATPELTILGRSPLGDESYSTPAVGNGRAYFRGFHQLACLKAKTTAASR